MKDKTNETIAELEHLSSNETNVLALELRLVIKDVDGIEDKAMSIKDNGDLVLVGKSVDLAQVGHAQAVASRALARQRQENQSDRLGLRESLLHSSDVDVASSVADGLEAHSVVQDVSLGSDRRTVGENNALLVRVVGLHHLTHASEHQELSSTLCSKKSK